MVLDDSVFLQAQHVIQVDLPRNASVEVRRGSRSNMETLVQVLDKLLCQVLVRRPQITDPLQPHRFHQTVLQHSMPTLHSPLRLGASRQNDFHPQFPHRPTELCQWIRISQGLIHRAIPRCFVDRRAIHIQRSRQSLSSYILLKHLHSRPCRFALEEFRVGPVRRVIDHHHQRGVPSPTFKPVVL